MSKILIVVFLAILIPFVITDSNTMEISEKVYNLIRDLFIGLVPKNETDINNSKCIKIITEKKQYIVENIDETVNAISDDGLFDKFFNNVLNIITIHGLAKNCKLMNFIFFYNHLTQLNEIQNLGQTIINKAVNMSDIFNPNRTESLFNKIGIFSRDILNFTVK